MGLKPLFCFGNTRNRGRWNMMEFLCISLVFLSLIKKNSTDLVWVLNFSSSLSLSLCVFGKQEKKKKKKMT